MEEKRFTIAYYTGEEFDRPKLKETHESIKGAVRWCQKNYVLISVVKITERQIDGEPDIQGKPNIVGSCSLEEAYEKELHSLDF